MSTQGAMPLMRMVGIATACVAVVTLVAMLPAPQADSAGFMDSARFRRLFVPKELQDESEHMNGYDGFLKHVLQYKDKLMNSTWEEQLRKRDGNKAEDMVCRAYGGIDHPNHKACCSPACGNKCGTSDCWNGAGGNGACCQGNMHNWCGVDQKAPCWMNISRLAVFYEAPSCQKYKGVGDPNKSACCSPACGEFCGNDPGTSACARGPGGAEQCCASKMKKPCGPHQSSPCYLAPLSVKYPGEDEVTKPDKEFDLKPVLTGGDDKLDFKIEPHVPKGWTFDKKTGDLDGELAENPKKLKKEENFKVIAENPAGKAEGELSFEPKAGAVTYDFPALSPGAKVKAAPKVEGGKPGSYSVAPALPTGLVLDAKTGEIAGTIAKDYPAGKSTVFITATNAGGVSTSTVVMEVGLGFGPVAAFKYKLQPEYHAGDKVSAKPELKKGDKADTFTVAPTLLKGLKMDKAGVITGKLDKHQKLGDYKFTVTATNKAGSTQSDFVFPVKKPPAPFPWWIVAVVALVICLIIWCMNRPAPDPTYVPLKPSPAPEPEPAPAPAPPPPPPPPPVVVKEPQGLPLTFDTGSGEKTVYAVMKPLGLVFQKVNPIKISAEKPNSHAQDIGIKVGWVLKKLGSSAWGAGPFDIASMPFEQADKTLHTEVGKLPGAIPLTFKTDSGDKTVYASKKPLGLTFDKILPIKITKETPGHGMDIGVQVGWELKSINYRPMNQLTSYADAEGVLKDEVGKLKPM